MAASLLVQWEQRPITERHPVRATARELATLLCTGLVAGISIGIAVGISVPSTRMALWPANSSAAAVVASPPVVAMPLVAVQAVLLTAPRSSAGAVLVLSAGTPLRVLARSDDGEWLLIGAVDRVDLVGWRRTRQVSGVTDPSRLPVFDPVQAHPDAGTGDSPWAPVPQRA